MNGTAEKKTSKAARTTVSMPDEMMNRATAERVAGNFPTFSAYVQHLIRKDLGKPVVEEQPEAKAA